MSAPRVAALVPRWNAAWDRLEGRPVACAHPGPTIGSACVLDEGHAGPHRFADGTTWDKEAA